MNSDLLGGADGSPLLALKSEVPPLNEVDRFVRELEKLVNTAGVTFFVPSPHTAETAATLNDDNDLLFLKKISGRFKLKKDLTGKDVEKIIKNYE